MSSTFPALLGKLTLIDLLLLLAPVVVVPLGLRLMPSSGRRARQLLALARLVQPLGALTAVIAFLVSAGWVAGAVALGWLITCAIVSLAGLLDPIEARSITPRHLVPAAASAYLSVGAAWLVASRLGLRPLGFSSDIIELTGVHFHYAGFAATLMAALTLLVLRGHRAFGNLASAAGVLVVLGVPITAGGIATGSAILTVVGPLLLGTGVLTIAGLMAVVVAPRVEPRTARWLLWLSAAGVVAPMLLGIDYALARVFPIPALDIKTMALIHGDLNAIVFSLGGLLGWSLILKKPWPTHPQAISLWKERSPLSPGPVEG